jgi:cbb3-type cytochrome oxidase cytochrome c subunit
VLLLLLRASKSVSPYLLHQKYTFLALITFTVFFVGTLVEVMFHYINCKSEIEISELTNCLASENSGKNRYDNTGLVPNSARVVLSKISKDKYSDYVRKVFFF